ncbi:hypothetical protein A33Q_2457 [Indibacter alkaliphilus LW1]|uniref:Fibrobacter succinogenes major paralogous domain-containing protein n=1 Tax=Indibacter alkaliphilus (strain CCUG 57479 / KCTC 22604 / LW1) TaxID=1189612 RepID=S2DW63_INDAL|nr:FISUMP domain-containing protein [Indibacter alkaliphilus]EOZ96336.1 hypothetical protein A33Q_2457 [Indibacter alkaliphilus LW1]
MIKNSLTICILIFLFISCSSEDEAQLIDQKESIVKDVEGNEYSVIEIRGRVWLQGNLKVTKFADGTQIPFIEGSSDWQNNEGAAYSWPYGNPNSNGFLGKLYNWEAANCCNICPEGFRLPTRSEFQEIRNYLGEYFLFREGAASNYPPFVLHTSIGAGLRAPDGEFYKSMFGQENVVSTSFWTSELNEINEPIIFLVRNGEDWGIENAILNASAVDPRSGISIKCIDDKK